MGVNPGGFYTKSVDLWALGRLTALLVTHRCPFQERDNRGFSIESARTANLFEHEGRHEWSALGRDTRDFIRKLLDRNGASRMTATQALAHNWINGSASDVESMSVYGQQDDTGIGGRGTNIPTRPTESIRELLLETPSQAEVSATAKKRRKPYIEPLLSSEQWDNGIRQLQDPNWLENPSTPPAVPSRRPPSSHSKVAETPSSFILPY